MRRIYEKITTRTIQNHNATFHIFNIPCATNSDLISLSRGPWRWEVGYLLVYLSGFSNSTHLPGRGSPWRWDCSSPPLGSGAGQSPTSGSFSGFWNDPSKSGGMLAFLFPQWGRDPPRVCGGWGPGVPGFCRSSPEFGWMSGETRGTEICRGRKICWNYIQCAICQDRNMVKSSVKLLLIFQFFSPYS